LGWSRYKGEIVTQETIPVGSAHSLKPDIIIKQDGRRLFVVELKKPNAELIARNTEQLISYMRQLKLDFGFLLGDALQVYYEMPGDGQDPVKVIEIPFVADNQDGAELVGLISKSNYDKLKLEKYCVEKLLRRAEEERKSGLIGMLCSETGRDLVRDALRARLLESNPVDVVDEVFAEISIGIQRKTFNVPVSPQPQYITSPDSHHQSDQQPSYSHSDKLQIDLVPANPNEFKRLLLENKHAVMTIYYQYGKMEKKPWNAQNFTENSNVMGNLRSRPEFRSGEWQKRGITKVVVEILKR
jgi:hypothetical protein